MALTPGTQLGPYEILSPLGAGGMGDVYRARDTRLGRDVALKVIPAAKARDADALARFEREARSASALNHPNIVTIYDVGQAQIGEDTISYIAMELVEGHSLRQALSKGPMAIEPVLDIALQAALALSAAHDKGIVHRDLKPDNIMVRDSSGSHSGLVKILDFGLAKIEVPGAEAELSSAATMGARTEAGTILGTIGYMSPEQASGAAIDFRSDQFSLGAILYEMATGCRAFKRETGVETLAAIIREEPRTFDDVGPQIPLPLQWTIKRCLAKNPEQRYASTRDLASELTIVRERLGDSGSETRTAPAHNLPAQRTPLIGREDELASAKQLLLRPDVRLVTFTGPAGTGKTRLALQVAEDLLDQFKGGVHFIPLAMIADPTLVIPSIAQALGVRPSGSKPLLEELKEQLRRSAHTPALVILDNFEQVMSAAPWVTELAEAFVAAKFLVTSRSVLHLYGEYEFSVPPLTLPDLEHLPDPETLSHLPAVSLFLQRAGALKPDFTLTADNLRSVAEICSRLDGLPLAIELAASRIKLLPPAAMLARLRSRLQLLTSGPRDLPARQQTLRAALDWSYELLSPAEQSLFRRLSVFVSGCTLEAAEAVCNPKGDWEGDLLDAMASLVDKSLLQQGEQADGEARFRMLGTVREYAEERLASSPEHAVTHRAHAAYCLVLAEEGASQMAAGDLEGWLNRFDLEQDNFRTALEWLTRARDVMWGLRLATALHLYWRNHAHPAEGRNRLGTFLNMAKETALPEGSGGTARSSVALRKIRAKALFAIADLALEQTDLPFARAALEQALEIHRELDDKPGIAAALNAVAVVRRDQGEYAAARELLTETVRLWQEVGDLPSAARVMSNLADVARAQSDYLFALAQYRESQAIFERHRDPTSVAWSLNHQGDLAREQGDRPAARSLYEQALKMFREAGNKTGSARSLIDLGKLANDEGRNEDAHQHFAEALGLFSELGETRDIPRVLEHLARAAADRGAWERALKVAGAAAGLRERFGTPLPPLAKSELEEKLEAARQHLGSGVAASAWMEGARMSPRKAIEYAAAPQRE